MRWVAMLLILLFCGCGTAQKVAVEPKSSAEPKTETKADPKAEAQEGGTANATSNVTTKTETTTTQETNTETSQDTGPKGKEVAGDVVQHQFRPERKPGAAAGDGRPAGGVGVDMESRPGLVQPDAERLDRAADRLRAAGRDTGGVDSGRIRPAPVKEVSMLAYRVTWFVIGCVVGPLVWANRGLLFRWFKVLAAKIADQK